MVKYDLEHLVQEDHECVAGPIQDTEALFLFAMVRGMRMKRILEVGGLSGYSATNFIKAFAKPEESKMYTVDLNEVPQVHPTIHKVFTKDAQAVTAEDIDNAPLDMVFFDCHDFDVQINLYNTLVNAGLITADTVIALHDTHVHPYQAVRWAYEVPGHGWVHQPVERRMVNAFVEAGYHAFSLHTPLASHEESMPFRHGVTVLQKFKPLVT